MAGPQIDRGSQKDQLTGIAMPFDGASILLGLDRRWYVDRRPGFHPLPPTPAMVKRSLRSLRDGLSPELRVGLRLGVMKARRTPGARILAAIAPSGMPLEVVERLAVEATERIVAALYREFGCVPSHWTSWIGRV